MGCVRCCGGACEDGERSDDCGGGWEDEDGREYLGAAAEVLLSLLGEDIGNA